MRVVEDNGHTGLTGCCAYVSDNQFRHVPEFETIENRRGQIEIINEMITWPKVFVLRNVHRPYYMFHNNSLVRCPVRDWWYYLPCTKTLLFLGHRAECNWSYKWETNPAMNNFSLYDKDLCGEQFPPNRWGNYSSAYVGEIHCDILVFKLSGGCHFANVWYHRARICKFLLSVSPYFQGRMLALMKFKPYAVIIRHVKTQHLQNISIIYMFFNK